MTYKGHIRNRTIVLDEPIQLPEGAEVTVEWRMPTDAPPLAGPNHFSDSWAALQNQIDSFQHNTKALIAQELLPPTATAHQRIPPLFTTLRNQNLDPPSRAIPNGDGGIMLEWIDASRHEMIRTIEISADGSVEAAEFANNQLQTRRPLL